MLKVQISQISMFKQVKLNLRQTFCSLSEFYSYCHHIDFQVYKNFFVIFGVAVNLKMSGRTSFTSRITANALSIMLASNPVLFLIIRTGA